MQDLSTTLSSLRDLEGIVGSFVVSETGDVVAKDLPAYFDGVLEEVGPRVLRLRDALDLAEGDVSACNVRYAGYKLTIRSMEGALIAVIADAKINGPALRMAMNLVIRKCGSEGGVAPSGRPSLPDVPLSAASSSAAMGAFPIAPATATPNSAESTRPARSETFEAAERAPQRGSGRAPESRGSSGSEGEPQRKKRELLFRGKRVG